MAKLTLEQLRKMGYSVGFDILNGCDVVKDKTGKVIARIVRKA